MTVLQRMSTTALSFLPHCWSRVQVYLSVGKKIKAELLSGNAVVLFAYGLSGSGKTFTVFGPDAVDEPEVTFGTTPIGSLGF